MPEEQEETEKTKGLIDKAQEICDLMDGVVDRLKTMEDKINGIDKRLKIIENNKKEEGKAIRTKFIRMLKNEFPLLFIEYNKDYNRIDINKVEFACPPFAYIVIHIGSTYSHQDLLNLIVLVKEDIKEKGAKEGAEDEEDISTS